MTHPKLKRDWIGLRVESVRELRSGMYAIPEGTRFEVCANHGGLNLKGDPCPTCGVSVYISRVPERDVFIVSQQKETFVAKEEHV